MKYLLAIGRIFFGICIAGIGVHHFFYPGIRPIIIPHATNIPGGLYWTVYLTVSILIVTGLLIIINKRFQAISLVMGAVFLVLLLFVHLPAFLAAGIENSDTWVKMNKVLALSGGFFLVSTIDAWQPGNKFLALLYRLTPPGRYLFAMMLYNFSVGHLVNLTGISHMVPKYIPFPMFWTFMGGVALMGGAISIFTRYKTKQVMLVLAAVLFIWLLSLHTYYTVLYPEWNDGENFVGVITCMAFCGIALIISQKKKDSTTAGTQS
jgi:uncharacterized membrane protein YphA (DoxX/SURF4 family)